MKLDNNNHLMYCLNIHPGEHWNENLQAIKDYTLKIKDRVCPDNPFALGLRLSDIAARELLANMDDFKKFLNQNSLYAVTINGFPFSSFHGEIIKDKVYLPDWSSKERVEYTLNLAGILAEILPEGETGSISTVPCCYGKEEKPSIISNLLAVSVSLKEIEKKTGKHILLCLEPEPDCYLDTLESTVGFFEKLFKADEQSKEYIGVCLDCCHAAVEFESPLLWINRLAASGIQIAKIQVSSAIMAVISDIRNLKHLFMQFNGREYLHQARVSSKGSIIKFKDLPDAMKNPVCGEWRVHFHVPLTWTGDGINSTAETIEKDFFRQIVFEGKKSIEVETYSYRLLSGTKLSLMDSIISELEWVKGKITIKQ